MTLPPIQFINTTSGNIDYALSLTTIAVGYVWITPNAGATANRRLILPTNPPVGYTIHVRNNATGSWSLLIPPAITNGFIYGAGTGSNLLSISGTVIVKYLGSVMIGTPATARFVWIA